MQRSSWQMLQSNLVWQAGHPLIQQIQSHINVTRKEECRTIYCVDVISSLVGKCREVAGVKERLKVELPWSRTPRRVRRR